MSIHRASICLAALFAAALIQPVAASLQDEIQVYVDDLNDPGQLNLQIHANATPSGVQTPSYTGETVNSGGMRATGEFAYGLTHDLEAGLYLPFVVQNAQDSSLAGLKVRLKWVPIRPDADAAGIFAGLNGELSHVAYRYDAAQTGFELRPILGWRGHGWLFALNPVLDIGLRAPDIHHAPEFQPSVKMSHEIFQGLSTGIEYYADVGKLGGFEPSNQQQRSVFWAVDIDRGSWNLNVGVGRGLTGATDAWTVKMIVGVPPLW